MPTKMIDQKTRIDEIDIKIIKCLLKNSRMSFADIAEECKVSVLTIKNRFSQLKRAGVIKGSSVILNMGSFGIEGVATFLIIVNNKQVNQFIKNLQSLTEQKSFNPVCYPVKFNERYNIVWSVPVKNIGEIQKLREKLKNQPGVRNIEINLCSTMKNFPQNLNLLPITQQVKNYG